MKWASTVMAAGMFLATGWAQDQTTHIAQIAHGSGFESNLNIVNLFNADATVQISTFDADGRPLDLLQQEGDSAAVSTLSIPLSGLGTRSIGTGNADANQVDAGYAVIRSSLPVGVEGTFRTVEQGRVLTTATVLPQPPSSGFSLLAFAGSSERTGLAILNPAGNGAPAQVTATLRDGEGMLVDRASTRLESGERIARFIDEDPFFPQLSGEDFSGSLDVRANVPVVAIVLKIEGGSFLTTQTIQPVRAQLTLTASAGSVSEGDGTVTVTATVPEGAEPAEDLTVTIAHSGSAAWDPLGFGDYGLGSLIVEAGQRSGTATLRANDDNIYEQDETVELVASASGYQSSNLLTITIENDDLPQFSLTASATSVAEPDGTVTLAVSVPEGTEPEETLTIQLSHVGSANHPADYTVGTLAIDAGMRLGTATLRAVDDDAEEGDETIVLRAAMVEGEYQGSAALMITLKDDD